MHSAGISITQDACLARPLFIKLFSNYLLFIYFRSSCQVFDRHMASRIHSCSLCYVHKDIRGETTEFATNTTNSKRNRHPTPLLTAAIAILSHDPDVATSSYIGSVEIISNIHTRIAISWRTVQQCNYRQREGSCSYSDFRTRGIASITHDLQCPAVSTLLYRGNTAEGPGACGGRDGRKRRERRAGVG